MHPIRIYVSKEKNVLAFSFDGVEIVGFPLSKLPFGENITYKEAYEWFYDEEGSDTDTTTQDTLTSRYTTATFSGLGLTEL